jgi:uncharacterized protein
MKSSVTKYPESILIPGPTGNLEALVEPPQLPQGNIVAIICHPHPLHGGTMNNKVVTTLVRACQGLGAVAVRFNFRGVGASEGVYDQAVGEQDDLKAVMNWAKKVFPGCRLWLGGFSFGSYVATRVASETSIDRLIAIAAPVHHFDFQSILAIQCHWLVVQGEADEVVPAEEVFAWLATRAESPQLIRMPGVSHFFHGKLIELREAIINAIKA